MRRFLSAVMALGLSASVAFAGRDTTENLPLVEYPSLKNFAVSQPTSAGRENANFDSGGFEAYANGALTGQFTWTQDVTAPFAVNPTAGVGGTKGVVVSGATTDWAYPTPVPLTPASGIGISVTTDIARTVGSTPNFAYAVDIFSSTTTRVARFGLTHSASQVRAFVTSRFASGVFTPSGAITNVLVSGALTAGTFYNFEARLDFATKTWTLLSGNVPIVSDIPFVGLTETTFSDADLQISAVAGGNDSGAFDNYLTTTYVIPEPASLSLLALGSLGLLRRRRD